MSLENFNPYDDLLGLIRSEGKEYVMEDGDVVLFRFNV